MIFLQTSNLSFLLIETLILFILGIIIFLIGYIKGKQTEFELRKHRDKRSRSVLGGMFSEQVAPFLTGFPKDLKASEARFIGKPVDFLIFKGMDEGDITEVVFVEIKSGKSQLTANERKLRDVINEKKVRWYEYRVDSEISKITGELIK